MKGRGVENLSKACFEIFIYDDKNQYKFNLSMTDQVSAGYAMEPTEVKTRDISVLKALSEALQELGLFPRDAVGAELVATKYHLEDMRKLTFGKDIK